MKYSIITINYNNCEGLRRTIESVVNQTCQDFEYIIIDGGSTDGSVEVIKEFADRIDYWVSEPDKGIYNAMNKGILQAHGEYLNFMNSGDCFYDSRVLQNILSFCKNDIFVGRVCSINEKNEIIRFNIEARQMTMFHFFLTTLPHQGCFIKRELFKEQLYDEELKIVSDWKFFMESIVRKDCSYTQNSIIVAKCESPGVSSDYRDLLSEKDKILRNYLDKGVYKDYKHLSVLGVELYDYIIYLTKFTRLRRICYYIIKSLVIIHQKIHKSKKMG